VLGTRCCSQLPHRTSDESQARLPCPTHGRTLRGIGVASRFKVSTSRPPQWGNKCQKARSRPRQQKRGVLQHIRGNSRHIGDSGALPMTDEKRLFRKRRFQLGPGPPKKSPAEAGLKLQGQGCPLRGTKTLSRSPCVTIHSALTQRVVIERVGVDMPARWASNYESPLALLEYGGYCSGGAALNARRWRRRFPPHRHENGLHDQSPWFGRGDFPASSGEHAEPPPLAM
jgi:hypothetical protein